MLDLYQLKNTYWSDLIWGIDLSSHFFHSFTCSCGVYMYSVMYTFRSYSNTYLCLNKFKHPVYPIYFKCHRLTHSSSFTAFHVIFFAVMFAVIWSCISKCVCQNGFEYFIVESNGFKICHAKYLSENISSSSVEYF